MGPDQLDFYTEVVLFWGGLISVVSSGLQVLSFCAFNQIRRHPLWMLLGLSCSEVVIAVHWMITVFQDFYGKRPRQGTLECDLHAIASTFCGSLIYFYNLSLVGYYFNAVRHTMSRNPLKPIFLHILAWIPSILFVLYLYTQHRLGENKMGICSITSSKDIRSLIVSTIPNIIFITLATSALFYLRRLLQSSDENEKDFLRFFSRYIMALIVLWTLITISFFFPYMVGTAWGDIVRFCGHLAKVLTAIVSSFFRFWEPALVSSVKALFSRKRISVESIDMVTPLMEEHNSGTDLPRSLTSRPKDPGLLIEGIREGFKRRETFSVIFALRYYFQKGSQRRTERSFPQLEPSMFSEEESFYLSETKVSLEINMSEWNKYLERGYGLQPVAIKCFAPRAFDVLLVQEAKKYDLCASLDPLANEEAIELAGQADGGRGGEFFFFSADRRLIIKSISPTELQVIREMLPNYISYLKDSQNSLLSKILSVIQVNFEARREPLNLLVMENIDAGVPLGAVLRRYDMKGSTIDRQVLTGSGFAPDEKVEKVLKDLDFLNFEEKLWVSSNYGEKIKVKLTRDTDLLRQLELMDYSLYLSVFDTTKIEGNVERFREGPLKFIPCTRPGFEHLAYNLGVIDYLQRYDFGKKFEKTLKVVRAFDSQVDVSAQAPNKYADRFMEFIARISPSK